MVNQTSSFLKAGFQGNTGTGKTMTSALLLLALSVERHQKAPVQVFDTEPGWQFVKPLYDLEGVELVISNGRHFKGLVEALRAAKKRGCCGFAADSLTHPWTELLQSFAGPDGRVPMHKFNQIKPMWNQYVVEFMDAPMHCIACGRLQWEMVTVEQEGGGYDVVRGDSKMKAGGGESFGYEPHLLVEFTHEQKRGKAKKAAGSGKLSGLEYVGFVLKDRTRALNGQELRFQDFREYKGYGPVYGAFLPHLAALEKIAGTTIGTATSAALVPGGDAEWHRIQQQKKIALEEIEGSIAALWPGQDAKSKKLKATVLEAIFNTRSWTKVELMKLVEIQLGQRTLQHYEKNVGPGDYTDSEVLTMLREINKKLASEPATSHEADPASQDGERSQVGTSPSVEAPLGADESIPDSVKDPAKLPF